MQTLTPTTVFPCYAAADREIAAQIAAFVERGADAKFFLDEGEIQTGEDLVSKARDARTADMVLVLFSRHSLPPRWGRAQWEAALVTEPAEEGVRVGFVRCDDCVPPKVLRPCFDLGEQPSRGLRAIKRWVRGRTDFLAPARSPELEWLGVALADRPGFETVDSAETALEFAEVFREDFDEVLRVSCGGRSLAALAGDLAAQLGVRLEGEAGENLARLGEFCAARRFLVVLDDARSTPAAAALAFGGRSSTLVALSAGPLSEDRVRQIQIAFAQPAPAGEWSELCQLARTGRRLLLEQGRLAECHELMEQWREWAEDNGDRAAMNEAAREIIWILQTWGREEEAWQMDYERVMACEEQLRLF